MKRKILLTALAALTLASCSKETRLSQESIDSQACELTINIRSGEQRSTKAGNVYTTELDYEKAINSLQLLIFDKGGQLRHYSTVEESYGGYTKTVSMDKGEKHVWAVANCWDLSDITDEDDLKAVQVKLENNSVDEDEGFIMADSQTVNLSGSSANVTLSMRRLVGRVALYSITNNLPAAYGALKINRVYLSNVVGNQNLMGNANPTLWYNKEGRMDETNRNSTHIIEGNKYKASCESLTFKSVNSTLSVGDVYAPEDDCVFYGMPNTSSSFPSGFHSTFSAQMTVLVVDATINSHTYYYPVVMANGILRNCSYTVYLTITDLGSDDPNKPVTRGDLDVTIEVSEWDTSVAAIDETI